jgi:sugar phosphate isomerase/epimerase
VKLSFTTLGCPDWSLEEIARRAAAYGYDGVELRVAPDGNHLSPDASPGEAARIAGRFRDAGVPVMSLMGYTRFALMDPAEIASQQALMRRLLALARAMEVPHVRTFGGQLAPGADREAAIRTVGDALAPLAAEAAGLGVRIGMETHDDWCAGDVVRRVIDRAASPGLGVVYDIFNAFDSGLESWDVTYDKVRDRIVYCHLKDGFRGRDGKLAYVPIGAGDLPLPSILGRLKRDRYAGYLSFEWEKKWHPELDPPERALPQFAHKARALWNSLPD